MGFKAHKIKPYGKPNLANASQTSNPKTPEEKVQALADLLETRLKGEIVQQYAERGLMVSDMKYALGTDGESLAAYDKQLENNFQGMAPKGKNQQPVDKETAPKLKKISTERAVEVNVPGAGGAGGVGKNKKK
ncbi:hypothetical protein [Dapis sp. BLCC M172]|uniref:hypothetical protein n=1 Tax=Dapis sp. BLCC M172 TaxID=2975281 RepID=UPI003CF8EA11